MPGVQFLSFFFLYFFLFLVFLTRWWFKDRLCNPNVTVTLRCQRAPLSSLFSLSFPVHTVQWTAPVAGQDVKESHVPDWNCMGNHPDWLVSCYPLVGVAQNCITVTSVEIACCKPNEQEGTVQSLSWDHTRLIALREFQLINHIFCWMFYRNIIICCV